MDLEVFRRDWITNLKTLIIVFIVFAIFKLVKSMSDYFYSNAYFKPCSIFTFKCSPILFYISSFLTIYKQHRPSSPLLCLFLQGLLGGCKIFEKEGIFKLYFGMKPGIFFYKPETVEAVLSSSTLIEKSIHYRILDTWLEKGLFTSSGNKWRKSRKLLTPTFHFSILEDFMPVVHEQSNVLISKLQTLTKEPWVDIVPLTALCTLDIICQTAMGIRMNAQSSKNEEYVQAVHEITDALINRGVRPWLYPDIIYYLTTEGKRYKKNVERVHGTTRKVIKEKKAEMLEHNEINQESEKTDSIDKVVKRKAFLELLLKHHFSDPSFTEERIKEEVDTFMFGGHDTTGMGLSFTLYCIGLHPEVQKKIVEELDGIFQGDIDREASREDLSQMKYLECTIKETFRLYPPVPFFLRECTATFEVLGHKVYPGSFCVIFPYALHRDRESFPDPEKFIPERFFPENSRERHPYAYTPFSAGPRNCIGQKFAMMEMKIVLSNILRHFHIASLDPRDQVLLTPNLVSRNTQPLRLKFEPR